MDLENIPYAEWIVLLGPYVLAGVKAIIVLVLGWVFSKIFYSRTVLFVQKRGLDLALGTFFAQMVRWGILLAAALAALQLVGIQVMGLVAVFASAGVAVGLALQGNLSNFASGVMILIFRPFDVGQVITAAGNTGAVQEIGLFATTLHTPDGLQIIVPNSAITGGVITNITARGTRRAQVRVGVAYGTDADMVMKLLLDVAASRPQALTEPAPMVIFADLGGSSIDFDVYMHTAAADFFIAQHELRGAIYAALNQAEIEIPFPQVVVTQASA